MFTKKNRLTLILAALLLPISFYFYYKPNAGLPRQKVNEYIKAGESQLIYHGKRVFITKHGACRMNCRHFDSAEVQDLLNTAVLNPEKTRDDGHECPSVALEGRSKDGQRTRLVVAECGERVKLVTIIDLDNEFSCDCK